MFEEWSSFHVRRMEQFSCSKNGAVFMFEEWSSFHVRRMEQFSCSKNEAVFMFEEWSSFHVLENMLQGIGLALEICYMVLA